MLTLVIWGQMGMNNWNSLNMFLIDSVHDWIMFVVAAVLSVVLVWMFSLYLSGFMVNRFLVGHEMLEIIWSVIPICLLGFLMGPSLSGLYTTENLGDSSMTLKVMGSQWFWSYEYPDFDIEGYSSYMLSEDDLRPGDYRNLEVDNSVILPSGLPIRVVISSEDVAHSWTIPVLGVKMDAIPGRLNEIRLFSGKSGLMYGQCSEICGSLHSFMPIKVEMIPSKEFLNTIAK
uniref:Cytochrome c oxidase subunit 2 n=1 Tax=Trichodectes canis TaxID=209909 RepID=A0A386B2A9_9NEOP|nr:cytochrome c oxidase subunit II [Trichodectes canis]